MGMQTVEYSIFCDYASLSMGGKLNLNGVFDQFLVKEFPFRHPQLFVASKLVIPSGNHRIAFSLMQEDKVLAKSQIERTVTNDYETHTHLWNIRDLELKTDTLLELHILIDGKEVYVKRLPLVKQSQ